MIKNKLLFSLLTIFTLLFLAYAIYSYSQIDLNLTLSSNQGYQSFQKSMIQLGYFNRPLSTRVYSLIIFILYTLYFILYTLFKKRKFSIKAVWWLVGISVGILILAYPALSHDIFNYMFNAKMVLIYQRNPHLYVALDFPHDTWVRFMHNVHTPAPYFYGWTLLSLIPSLVSFNKIIPNIINFKLFEIPFFVWQIYLLNKILGKLIPKERLERLFLFVLNPLVLIEVFGNGHNDIIMTSLALHGLWFLVREEKTTVKNLFLSIFFLLLSASIKYVTIILLPLYLTYAYIKNRKYYSSSDAGVTPAESRSNDVSSRQACLVGRQARTIKNLDIGSLSAIVLFLAIFTRPQDQFQPWYLIWALSFAVFARNKWLLRIILFFSFSLMLRYIPIIFFGQFKYPVLELESLVTYVIPLLFIFVQFFLKKSTSEKLK